MKSHFYPFLNKCHYRLRWGLMGFCVWIVLGSYYCFDIPTALHNSLRNHFADMLTDQQFELYFSGLYSFYSFANIFLPFLSGRLRDARGDRLVLILMIIFIIVGQMIFAYGVSVRSFLIMYFGRILSGWGMESISPTQTSFISPYFKDDYLGFVVGTNEFFATLGSICTMYFCPRLSQEYGLMVAVSSGTFINLFSFACSLVAVAFDKHAEREIIDLVDYQQVKNSYFQEGPQPNQEPQEGVGENQIIIEHPKQVEDAAADGEEGLREDENQQNLVENGQELVQSDVIDEIKTMPRLFWFVIWFHGIIYSSVLGFINISVGMLSERWYGVDEDSEIRAGYLVALMWFITGIITPAVGWLTDHYGYRSSLIITSSLLCTISHITIWYIYPFLSLILLGTSLSLAFSAAWTGVVYLVRPDYLGKAYALVIAVNNLTFSVVPIGVGGLRAYTGSYYYSQLMLSSLGVIAFCLALVVYKLDKEQENILDGNGVFAQSATSLERKFPGHRGSEKKEPASEEHQKLE